MKTASVLKYLRSTEWTMGNGQCHVCEGCNPHYKGWQRQSETLGHRRSCRHAKAIVALGGEVVWHHKNKSAAHKAHNEHREKLNRPWFDKAMAELKAKGLV